jgi:hypothetical protein
MSVYDTAAKKYPLYAEETMVSSGYGGMMRPPNDLTKGLLGSVRQCASPLSNEFFGPINVNRIQTDLRTLVRAKTGYNIDRQSDEQLAIIMRAVYVLEARHGIDIPSEIARLNAIVIGETAQQVGSGLAQYLAYLRDASQMPVPLERSVNASIKGRNTFVLFKGL